MKLITLLSLISIVYSTASCGQSESYQESPYENEAYQETMYQEGLNNGAYNEANPTSNTFNSSNTMQNNSINPGSDNLIWHSIKNPKTGMESSKMLLPANWQNTGRGFKSPEGAETIQVGLQTYNMQPNWIRSIDGVIQQHVMPAIQKVGGQVTNQYRLPEIIAMDQKMYSMYWQAMPCRNTHDAIGIEFDLPSEGKKSMIILHFTLTESQYGSMSMCYGDQLTTKSQNYNKDKKVFVNSLANIRVNPQFVAAHNQREKQKSQVAWSNHNQKMRNNQANFDAWNKNHVNTYNEINRMSMETYRNNSNSSNRMQEQYVNGIWEQQDVTNPYTGEGVKVESGYNQYYMNSNNEYIGTDDYFYNPNQDPNMNNTEWQQTEW
ncbi:hypothetical protein [Flexithrix dorotheae]|uniref:hypothetical protein n=1 Tax=Flexithrix dorotheae TaxID=70993 RepID=UPI000368572F|nr:hypothetical protein [Flexithrix dorotheae]